MTRALRREPAPRSLAARALALFALATLLGLAPACDRPERPPDIVLFTVDTLRADAVGAYRPGDPRPSPTSLADRWAAEGVLLERCFAPRGQTQPSLASLLTGRFPAAHGVRRNGDRLPGDVVPLPVLLKGRGYRTAGFAASLDRSRWDFWIRGFDVIDDGTGGAFMAEVKAPDGQRRWDERVAAAAVRWIESLPADDAAPLFLWVHVFDAHEPYTPDPALAARFVDPAYRGPLAREGGPPGAGVAKALRAYMLGEGTLDAADAKHVRELYEASIAGCDSRLAEIEAALAKKGRLATALRVYTADHGEDLGERKRYYGHGNSIYDTSLRVPAIVVWRGTLDGGRRVRDLAQNVDLFATLLTAAGIALPAGCEGLDLLPLLRGEDADRRDPRERVFAEWEEDIASVSDGVWKLIANPRGVQPNNSPFDATPDRGLPYACSELYNVAADPLELRDLFRKDDPEAVRLRGDLTRFLSSPARRGTTLPAAGDEEALRALGYLGGTTRRPPRIDCGDDR